MGIKVYENEWIIIHRHFLTVLYVLKYLKLKIKILLPQILNDTVLHTHSKYQKDLIKTEWAYSIWKKSWRATDNERLRIGLTLLCQQWSLKWVHDLRKCADYYFKFIIIGPLTLDRSRFAINGRVLSSDSASYIAKVMSVQTAFVKCKAAEGSMLSGCGYAAVVLVPVPVLYVNQFR